MEDGAGAFVVEGPSAASVEGNNRAGGSRLPDSGVSVRPCRYTELGPEPGRSPVGLGG